MSDKSLINLDQSSPDQFSKFKLTSRGVLIKESQEGPQILLCYNLKSQCYVLPGGCIEHGEGARQTLVRELLEEFGVSVEVEDFLFVFEQVFARGEQKIHDYSFVFSFKPMDINQNFVQAESHIKPVLVDLSKLELIDFKPKIIIKSLLENINKKTTGSFISAL